MSEQIKQNRELILKLRNIAEVINNQRDLLNKIGMTFRTLTKERTQKGQDIHGNQFQGYSDSYQGVRRRLRRPLHPVDLTIDDVAGMIAKIDHQVDNNLNSVRAYIADSQKALIGRYHAVDGAGKNKIVREWWGLTEEQKTRLSDIIGLEIDTILEKEL